MVGEATGYLLVLRDRVEELRDSGAMHRLLELEARHRVLASVVGVAGAVARRTFSVSRVPRGSLKRLGAGEGRGPGREGP